MSFWSLIDATDAFLKAIAETASFDAAVKIPLGTLLGKVANPWLCEIPIMTHLTQLAWGRVRTSKNDEQWGKTHRKEKSVRERPPLTIANSGTWLPPIRTVTLSWTIFAGLWSRLNSRMRRAESRRRAALYRTSRQLRSIQRSAGK